MITRKEPILRLEFVSGQTGTEFATGKFATVSADAQTMSIVTASTTIPHGVITQSDAIDRAKGNGGDIALSSYQGVVQVQINATAGSITAGSDLALCADGTVKLATNATGEIVVARSWTKPNSATGGQLIEATLYNPPIKK